MFGMNPYTKVIHHLSHELLVKLKDRYKEYSILINGNLDDINVNLTCKVVLERPKKIINQNSLFKLQRPSEFVVTVPLVSKCYNDKKQIVFLFYDVKPVEFDYTKEPGYYQRCCYLYDDIDEELLNKEFSNSLYSLNEFIKNNKKEMIKYKIRNIKNEYNTRKT